MKGTTKRLMVLLGMLALALTTAVPASAQEQQQYGGGEVSATGVIVDELPADVAANGTHSISDEATGTLYALRSAGPDLDSYGGQRVTVYGTLTPGEGPAPGQEFGGSLPLIDVTRVEPAGEVEPGPRVITATGVLGEPYTPSPDPTPVYDLTDEATGNTYTLFDISAGLEPFVGQRVTVEGTRSPGIDPLSLDVTSVVPVGPGGPPPGPTPGSNATIAFELAVECEPPANAEFLAFTSFESIVTAPLTDPDGDGLYTGSLSAPKFAPGPVPPRSEPISLSFQIVQGPPTGYSAMGPEYRVIKDFGSVKAEDTTLSASVSFCDGGTEPPAPTDPEQPTTNPEQPTDECEALSPMPEECEGYVAPVGSGSGSGSGGGIAVVSGDTNNADKGDGNAVVPAPVADVDGNGSVDASDGEKAAEISGSAAEGSASSAVKVLPATGGVLPIAGAVGALLIAGGLVARRFMR